MDLKGVGERGEKRDIGGHIQILLKVIQKIRADFLFVALSIVERRISSRATDDEVTNGKV